MHSTRAIHKRELPDTHCVCVSYDGVMIARSVQDAAIQHPLKCVMCDAMNSNSNFTTHFMNAFRTLLHTSVRSCPLNHGARFIITRIETARHVKAAGGDSHTKPNLTPAKRSAWSYDIRKLTTPRVKPSCVMKVYVRINDIRTMAVFHSLYNPVVKRGALVASVSFFVLPSQPLVKQRRVSCAPARSAAQWLLSAP